MVSVAGITVVKVLVLGLTGSAGPARTCATGENTWGTPTAGFTNWVPGAANAQSGGTQGAAGPGAAHPSLVPDRPIPAHSQNNQSQPSLEEPIPAYSQINQFQPSLEEPIPAYSQINQSQPSLSRDLIPF
ncbi:hypothetical protein WISP_01007 [Willisornis vidua]|uniref:Secreted protein n=1 Tax=Willisornis vidua TaxID=1566151 RepID=A0ABQ9DZH0_9PASS|nr:hypothetical protein WISP_01007 [Willisornis vidua]